MGDFQLFGDEREIEPGNIFGVVGRCVELGPLLGSS